MTTIGLATDIHLGYERVDEDVILDSLDSLVEEFKFRDVDGVFLLGDQIHEQSVEQDKENLKRIRNKFRDFDTFHALIGNHDSGYVHDETFVEIMESPLDRLLTIDGRDIVMMNTGSVNNIQNIGEISEDSLEVCEAVNNPIIFTHFPITYTDSYQNSPYFDRYPEGVFAINKYSFEQRREEGLIEPSQIVTGHLHQREVYQDEFDCTNQILSPFVDFDNETTTGSGAVFDFESMEMSEFEV